jgi:acyl carrier protein
MTRQDIEQKVTNILVDILGVEPEEVKNDANFEDDLGGDSLDCVEVLMEIEHEFNIHVSDADAYQAKTIGDICDMVEQYVK